MTICKMVLSRGLGQKLFLFSPGYYSLKLQDQEPQCGTGKMGEGTLAQVPTSSGEKQCCRPGPQETPSLHAEIWRPQVARKEGSFAPSLAVSLHLHVTQGPEAG